MISINPIFFDNIDNIGKRNVTIYNNRVYLFEYPCISNVNCSPYDIDLEIGTYQIECWGASGGNDYFNAGYSKGAYVSGVISLREAKKMYLYIGGQGTNATESATFSDGGYNGGGGGGQGASGGGGGTDVRLIKDNFASRIIVAGGGSGGEHSSNGHGGALSGMAGQYYMCGGHSNLVLTQSSLPGTQTEGGRGGSSSHGIAPSGQFGKGGDGYNTKDYNIDNGPGGGGGYFGGGGATWTCSGSGGSSYISGMIGCHSVPNDNSTETEDNPIHYSRLSFKYPVMIPGNNPMPSYEIFDQNWQYLNTQMIPDGNTGHGAIRITILQFSRTCKVRNTLFITRLFVYIIVLLKK